MTRPAPTEEQEKALQAAASVCARLADLDEDRRELIEERDTAWLEAFALGVTQIELADGCECSEILVRQRLAKARNAPWASKP